jgi:Tol biopolymer transport system component
VRDQDAVVRGDVLAYSCKERGNIWFAICVMKSDGSEKHRLTSNLTTSDPAWSPDGRQIAFTRNEDVGEYTTFTDDDVFVMDADGHDPHQVTREWEGLMSGQPTWSPDGGEIAFVRGESVATVVPSRFGDLLVMSADGSDMRRLVRRPVSDPDWSPDGSAIVYTRGDNLASRDRVYMDLYVVDVAGGTPRQLTRTAGVFETAPAWSPDGSRIAFARWTNQSQYDGRETIHVMNRDGTGEKLLLAHQHFASGPESLTWSPDGRTIAFETSPVRDCTAVALVDADAGSVRRLTSCSGFFRVALAPSWQPADVAGER